MSSHAGYFCDCPLQHNFCFEALKVTKNRGDRRGRSSQDIDRRQGLPTFLAAAGAPDVKEKLLDGFDAGGTTYKVHLDGYNALLPFLTGQEDKGPRKDWKVVFMEQRATGTLEIWSNPFTPLRVPKLFNLRRDPYERADITSNTYYDWALSRALLSCRRRPMSASSWKPSKPIHLGKSRRASASVGRWRRWRRHCHGSKAILTRAKGSPAP